MIFLFFFFFFKILRSLGSATTTWAWSLLASTATSVTTDSGSCTCLRDRSGSCSSGASHSRTRWGSLLQREPLGTCKLFLFFFSSSAQGRYECQVNTSPQLRREIMLTVVGERGWWWWDVLADGLVVLVGDSRNMYYSQLDLVNLDSVNTFGFVKLPTF